MNSISLLLHPQWPNDTISAIDIQISITANQLESLTYPTSGFGNRIPFPEYDHFILADDQGHLPYTLTKESEIFGPLFMQRICYSRAVQGTLRYSYTIYPRILPADYRSCPYFDFRNEEYGATGSGLFSLILPNDDDTEYQLHTSWDLSDLPQDCSALFNIENYEHTKLQHIRFSFFMVGKMQMIASDSAKMFWLKEPDFDIRSLGKRVTAIFDAMKKHFMDETSNFTIFIRRDPFAKSGGGTACPYAFLSGYSTLGTTELPAWENVLVHEMTHTWPSMEKPVSDHPLTWFNEGMVEYYCAILPYRYGFYTKEYLLQLLNNKATERYYGSKYRTWSEKAIEQVQWTDMSAQATPYGKGFMYLAMVAYQLRRKGKSLDDIVISKYHSKLTEQNWIDFLEKEFGTEGLRAYQNMLDGELIIPPDDLFEGFITESFETTIDGQQAISYRWKIK